MKTEQDGLDYLHKLNCAQWGEWKKGKVSYPNKEQLNAEAVANGFPDNGVVTAAAFWMAWAAWHSQWRLRELATERGLSYEQMIGNPK